ncbi:hypothetical protein NC652_035137 [Populus alba x Populus x berolinensis]|nr:hypothetical protein NC652_035137 [Populus alba x Populus x berolinensis]
MEISTDFFLILIMVIFWLYLGMAQLDCLWTGRDRGRRRASTSGSLLSAFRRHNNGENATIFDYMTTNNLLQFKLKMQLEKKGVETLWRLLVKKVASARAMSSLSLPKRKREEPRETMHDHELSQVKLRR